MRTWRLGGDGCSSSITHIVGHGSTVLSLTRVPASSFSDQVLVLKRFSVLVWVADVWEFCLLLFKANSLLVRQPLLGLLSRGGRGDVNVHVACVSVGGLNEGPIVWRNLHPRWVL